MKIHEALSKSNKIRRSCWYHTLQLDYELGIVFDVDGEVRRGITQGDLQANDWEPILKKKVVYQALFRSTYGSYFVCSRLYPSTEKVEKNFGTGNTFIKLLTDRPIEVEATDEK